MIPQRACAVLSDLKVPAVEDVILFNPPSNHSIACTFRKTLYIFFHATIMLSYYVYFQDFFFPFLALPAWRSLLYRILLCPSMKFWSPSKLLDIVLLLLCIFSRAILSKHWVSVTCLTPRHLFAEPCHLLVAQICIFKCLLYIST